MYRSENVSKRCKGRTVVDQLSFTVQQKETFGLPGHNGAGKSTTIETMLGLKKADYHTLLKKFGLVRFEKAQGNKMSGGEKYGGLLEN